jgi:hypothetical protein
MAEPSPPVIERPRETEVYRPLSGVAVAAFALALIYAIVLAIVAVSSLLSRTPPFLAPWTLVIPAFAFLLAIGADQHLRYAEGTRSGESLIRWAKRLTVLGLLYLAVYVAIFISVKLQAERFTRAWFDKVKDGKLAAAFLDTRKPEERDNDDPNLEERVQNRYGTSGGGKGEYAGFREQDIVQVLTSGGPIEIEERGVRELEYEQGGYRVELSYRITTPEGVYDWNLTARSSTKGKQREWMITAPHLAERPQLTALGESRAMMKDDALRFIMISANKRSMGDMLGFYLDTASSQRRTEIDHFLKRRTAGVVGLQIATSQFGSLPFLTSQALITQAERGGVPGFEEFQKQTLGKAEPPPRSPANPHLDETVGLFSKPDVDLRLRVAETGRLLLTVVDDRTVRCEKDVEISVLDKDNPLPVGPKYTLEGRMVVEGVTPEGYQRPEWRLVKIALLREKPAGPDPRGGPPRR